MLMKIYWTLKDVPELSGLPSEERMRVWRAAHGKLIRHWQYWAGLVGVGLCAGISVHIGGLIGAGVHIGGLIGVGVGGFVGGFIFDQVSKHLARPYIRATLLHQNAYLSDERAEERHHRPISGQELLTAALVVGVLVALILLVSYAHDALRGIAPAGPILAGGEQGCQGCSGGWSMVSIPRSAAQNVCIWSASTSCGSNAGVSASSVVLLSER
jgi:hypothetical protein